MMEAQEPNTPSPRKGRSRTAALVTVLWAAALSSVVYQVFQREEPQRYCLKVEPTCGTLSLGRIGNQCVYQCPTDQPMTQLLANLKHESALERRAAAENLSNQKNSDVVTALIGALHDTDFYVRVKAAQSLKSIGTSEAVAAIKDLKLFDGRLGAAKNLQ